MARRSNQSDLERDLGALLEPLSDSERQALLQTIAAAKREQKADLDSAINEGMSFVPALLRGTLRRILFP